MKKILMIEDDTILNENISTLLNLSGYEVLCANDGKKGVEMAIKEEPDLILCDIKMPNLDGYGVLHILSHHPKTTGIPFIFLTGNADFESLRKGMAAGADDYLIKPCNESDLLNTINVRLIKNEYLKRKFHNHSDNSLSSSNNINIIAKNHETYTFKKKHILFEIGQRPTSLFYVNHGKIKEYLVNEDGKELITGIYSEGDFFGYTELFKNSNYSKKAQAIEDSSLTLIPKDIFLQLIHEDTIIAHQFINILSKNISENEEIILNMAYNSLRKKVAQGIVRIIDKFKDVNDGKPIVDISREDLSNLIGSSQESMIRTLKEFKLENLIDVGSNGRITIINEEKLRKLRF